MREKLSNFLSRVRSAANNFFLRKYQPAESTLQLLREIYPRVDWKRVDFYEGLPWFTSFVAPFVTAQALPHFYSLGRYRIYLKRFDESKVQGLADIVHEGFHVLQAMQLLNGYGAGIFRGFYIIYIAQYIKHGYHGHPLEIPAYNHEYRFLDFCSRHSQNGVHPVADISMLKRAIPGSGLVSHATKYRYRQGLPRIMASVTLCLLVLLLKPLLDTIVFLIYLQGRRKPR